jgi:hypothetical protein
MSTRIPTTTPPATVAIHVSVWTAMRLARMAVGEIRDNANLARHLRGTPAHRDMLNELHREAAEVRPVIGSALAAGWNPACFRRLPAGGAR